MLKYRKETNMNKLKRYAIQYSKNNNLFTLVIKAKTEKQAEVKFSKDKDYTTNKSWVHWGNPKGDNLTAIWEIDSKGLPVNSWDNLQYNNTKTPLQQKESQNIGKGQ